MPRNLYFYPGDTAITMEIGKPGALALICVSHKVIDRKRQILNVDAVKSATCHTSDGVYVPPEKVEPYMLDSMYYQFSGIEATITQLSVRPWWNHLRAFWDCILRR